MTRIVRFCAGRQRPRIGAHPSYPDREGFGRRSLRMEPDALRLAVAAQCRALAGVASRHGETVGWVKPHGALYHDAAGNESMSRELLAGVREALGTAIIIGPPRGWLRDVAIELGMQYLSEGFADRAVRADGSLVPRNEPGALITDPQAAAARARELIGSVDTICVHADTPGALAIARAVREAIDG